MAVVENRYTHAQGQYSTIPLRYHTSGLMKGLRWSPKRGHCVWDISTRILCIQYVHTVCTVRTYIIGQQGYMIVPCHDVYIVAQLQQDLLNIHLNKLEQDSLKNRRYCAIESSYVFRQ